MPDTPSRSLRKDAAVNRERLLTAARELFAAARSHRHPQRHRPSRRRRDRHRLSPLREQGRGHRRAVRRGAAEHRSGGARSPRRPRRLARPRHVPRAVAEPAVWRPRPERADELPRARHARISEARDRIAPLIQALVDKAKEQGVVRPDLEQSDLIFAQVALSAVMASSRGIEPDLYLRYLTIILDGIRTDRAVLTPFPVAALSAHQTHDAMTGRRPDSVQVRRARESGGDRVERPSKAAPAR